MTDQDHAPALVPGATFSFSSGGDASSIENLNVRNQDNARAAGLAEVFPEVIGRTVSAPPDFIDFYPSGFGGMPAFLSIVCGMRVLTALKSITLARQQGMTVIFSGQPLGLGEIAAQLQPGDQDPQGHALLLIGGYESFAGLKEMMSEAFGKVFQSVDSLHFYGVNEVNFGLLAGQRTLGKVVYKPIQTDWEIDLESPVLANSTTGLWLEVEGRISATESGYEITQPLSKISKTARDFLSGTPRDWWRAHTGHIGLLQGKVVAQLRAGTAAVAPEDMTYGTFIDAFGMELQEKPNWGI